MTLRLSIGKDRKRKGLQAVCVCDRLSVIKQSSNRWKTSSIFIEDVQYLSHDGNTHACFRTLYGTTFRSLTGVVSDIRGESTLSTIRSWSLPSLTKLEVLKDNHSLPFLDAAVSLESLLMWFFKSSISAEMILQTLSHASLSHLRRLKISWSLCRAL
jgi:hypothetical protein